MSDKIRILFLSANPLDTKRLDLEEEAHEIEEKIKAAKYRDNFEFTSKWAVRPGDLQNNLLWYKPHIVHFSSHGSRSGEIILRGACGKFKCVGKNALTGLFRTLKDNVRLVVLNTCYSKEQAQAIVKVIECAVGTRRTISDETATAFAAAFYEGLAFGRSVKKAFELGLNMLEFEGYKDESKPVLCCSEDTDPSRIFFVGAKQKPDVTEVGDAEISSTLSVDGSIPQGGQKISTQDAENLEQLVETEAEISNKNIRVVLADDHAIVLRGLSMMLKQETDIDVVGQELSGSSTIDRVRELSPDVVVMDIGMPDINGIDATRIITSENPHVRVIALSMHSDAKHVKSMLKAGACGYLIKDCQFEELGNAIRTVMSGKSYLSPSITDGYIRATIEEKPSVLSDKERQVLKLLAEGKTTKQIALALSISLKTVEARRLRIMNKLDVDNLAQLIRFAIQEGLVSPDK